MLRKQVNKTELLIKKVDKREQAIFQEMIKAVKGNEAV